MAIVIPDYVHRDIKSAAERNLFEIISKETNLKGWICFHSLGIARHQRKRAGEIDFLLMSRKGIYCLEVKGGNVKREKGIWVFTDRYGAENRKRESPFDQASSAMYSIQQDLVEKFGREMKSVRFGYGVVFPDIRFNKESPEWDLDMVCDISFGKEKFETYITRLVNYWDNKLGSRKKDIEEKGLESIGQYLRGDFELIESLWKKIEKAEDEVIRLTENQCKNLDRMRANKKVIFRGPAGTGKTLLAIEQLKRKTFQGKRCLFLCFNKFLSKKISSETGRISDELKGNVDYLHGYFTKMIKKAGLFEELQGSGDAEKQDRYFNILFPEYFKKSLDVVKPNKYDCFIFDEAQDFMRGEIYDALGNMLRGGFERGEWYIFCDPNNQGDLYGNFERDLADKLTQEYGGCILELDLNCRNTKNIAINTSVISGFKMAETLNASGVKVIYKWYSDLQEQKKVVGDILNDLRKQKIRPGDITVLYNGCDPSEKEGLLLLGNKYPLVELSQFNLEDIGGKKITLSTAQSFKGLENKVIIFAGISLEDSSWMNTLNYVGLSRARDVLYILMDEKFKNQYEQRIVSKYNLGAE